MIRFGAVAEYDPAAFEDLDLDRDPVEVRSSRNRVEFFAQFRLLFRYRVPGGTPIMLARAMATAAFRRCAASLGHYVEREE